MSDVQTRISIPLKLGPLEIAGSEVFVKAQLAEMKEFITSSLASTTGPRAVTAPKALPRDQGDELDPASDETYPNVLAFEGETVRVICPRIPGNKDAEKVVNAALLGLLGKLVLGKSEMTFDEIRLICKDHACLDATNFVKYLKGPGARQNIQVIGKRGSYSAKLTIPGQAAARQLGQALNSQ
jgi:hypothetical protein